MRIEDFRSQYINYPVTVKRSIYVANGATVLMLFDDDGAPACTVTCNLPGTKLEPDEVIVKGWSENTGVPDALMRAGVIGPELRSVPTGYVRAGIHKLIADVENLNPEREPQSQI